MKEAQGLALPGEGSPVLPLPQGQRDRQTSSVFRNVSPATAWKSSRGGEGAPLKASAVDAVRGQDREGQDISRQDRIWTKQRSQGGPGVEEDREGGIVSGEDGIRSRTLSVCGLKGRGN